MANLADEWAEMEETGVITVPDGPWAVLGHPNREIDAAQGIALDSADPEEVDPTKKSAWREEYPLVTDQGLPVHPMARMGVTAEVRGKESGVLYRLGMATGIGRERWYGALNTGAMLVARLGMGGEVEYPVVSELRGNKMRRSFPGGYAEPNETIAQACIREGNEESGIAEALEAAGIPWGGVKSLPHELWKVSPAVTGPCTLNAWLAEHFLVIDAMSVPDMRGVVLRSGEPEIMQAEWLSAREIMTDRSFLGAHRRAMLAHMAVVGAR